jgi:glycerol kinase
MPSRAILAIDQGTTNTKALLVDDAGRPLFRVSHPLQLILARQEFVEQDPLLLWQSLLDVTSECRSFADSVGAAIEGIAISNQRETAVAWHAKTGKPLCNAVSWQCRRSVQICDRLAPSAGMFRARTGLPLAPLVSAGKWAWMLENEADIQELAASGNVCFGTVDSWLIYKLTGGSCHVTDLSNASRTGLLNLDSLAWDEELLQLFGIPFVAMPQLIPSSGVIGVCSAIPGLREVPIVAAIGDSHAALVGHGSYAPGTIKATYGTGSSLMALTPSLAKDTPALARTIAWSIGGDAQFALEGNIAMAGSAVQWVGEFLGLVNPTAKVVALANSVPDSNGIYFVPAMVGLGAPHWDSAARGVITGLGRSHTAAHLARAALDSIAYQVADVFFAMQAATTVPLSALHADGGATRNSELMQFQADILATPVLRSSNEELSALGAAWLGGLALKWWSSLTELEGSAPICETFKPSLERARRDCLYRGWQQAVRRTCLHDEAQP